MGKMRGNAKINWFGWIVGAESYSARMIGLIKNQPLLLDSLKAGFLHGGRNDSMLGSVALVC